MEAKKIGITGGIGSGKTTVCKIFETLGIPVYYADARAKQIMVEDSELVKTIKSPFGDEAYIEGVLNRSYLANLVFKDKEQLEKYTLRLFIIEYKQYSTRDQSKPGRSNKTKPSFH